MSPTAVQNAIKKITTQIDFGKKVSLHTLRHSYATHLLGLVSLKAIQKYLGHSSLQTTMIYLLLDASNKGHILTASETPAQAIGLGLVGVFLSWGADLTFQEGLRCLRAHRRKHAMLEQQAPPYNVSFVFEGSAFNHRDVLEAGPLLILTLSLCLIVIAFLQLVN